MDTQNLFRKISRTLCISKVAKIGLAGAVAFGAWRNKDALTQYYSSETKTNRARMFGLKVKYDENNNVVMKGSRFFKEKVGSLFGRVCANTEWDEVMAEIRKTEPKFNPETFIKTCERDIIPKTLDAYIKGDLDTLKKRLFEEPYKVLAPHMESVKKSGLTFKDSKVLEIGEPRLLGGKKTKEWGPVLMISFSAKQIMVLRDSNGKIHEGDPDKIIDITYMWVLCRDQKVGVWKLLDVSVENVETSS